VTSGDTQPSEVLTIVVCPTSQTIAHTMAAHFLNSDIVSLKLLPPDVIF